MGKICVECEDPSWTGQDPIQAPELPVDGGGVKVVDELPEKGQKGMAYVLVDDIEAPTTSQGIFVYDEGWILTAQPVSESVQMVEELPEEGQPGVLYYVPKTGDDTYDLYRWMNNNWVKVDTDIKLYAATGQNTDGAMTQKATSDAISASLGKAKVLTTADYNYNVMQPSSTNYTHIAPWLLEPGVYTSESDNLAFAADKSLGTFLGKGSLLLVGQKTNTGCVYIRLAPGSASEAVSLLANGTKNPLYSGAMLTKGSLANNLTTTSAGFYALDAVQGKALNDKITALAEAMGKGRVVYAASWAYVEPGDPTVFPLWDIVDGQYVAADPSSLIEDMMAGKQITLVLVDNDDPNDMGVVCIMQNAVQTSGGGFAFRDEGGFGVWYFDYNGEFEKTEKGLTTLTYGVSTWADFFAAYGQNKIVYCNAGSGNDPSVAPYTRQAFMAYVNNNTNPTEVEFQYVRSVSSKSASQQCDQVFVYKLTNANGGTWTVATRNMAANVAAGANAERTYSNGTVTINPRLYTTTGQNTDGGITQKLFTDTVGDIEAALQAINNGGNS